MILYLKSDFEQFSEIGQLVPIYRLQKFTTLCNFEIILFLNNYGQTLIITEPSQASHSSNGLLMDEQQQRQVRGGEEKSREEQQHREVISWSCLTEHCSVINLLEDNHADLGGLQLRLSAGLAAVEAAVLPGGRGEDEGDGDGGGRLVGDHGDPRPGPGVGDEAGVVSPGDLNRSYNSLQ